MTTTLYSVSFQGKLAEAMEGQKSILALKKQNLEARQGAEESSKTITSQMKQDADDCYKSSKKAKQDGKETYKSDMDSAKFKRTADINAAQATYQTQNNEAEAALAEAKQRTAELVNDLNAVAESAENISKESKQNIKKLEKSGKSAAKAAKLLKEAKKADTLSESVKTVNDLIGDAEKATQTALAKIDEEKKLQAGKQEENKQLSKQKREEASKTQKEQNIKAESDYKEKLTKIEEEKAQALDNANKAFDDLIQKAEETLQGYEKLEGADKQKAKDLKKSLAGMKKEVRNIKVKSFIARSKNLPQLAAATVGLDGYGESATGSIANRIVRTLKQPDWFATAKDKLGAVEAANIFLNKGTPNEKSIIASNIELNAGEIVDSTENLDVINALTELDKKIDEQK